MVDCVSFLFCPGCPSFVSVPCLMSPVEMSLVSIFVSVVARFPFCSVKLACLSSGPCVSYFLFYFVRSLSHVCHVEFYFLCLLS